jgi:hypothetical protein
MEKNAHWQKISVENFINSPVQSYCIPFVRCESKLVMFGKPRTNEPTTGGALSNPTSPTSPAIPFMSASAGGAMANYEFLSAPALTIAAFNKASVVPRKCTCFAPVKPQEKQLSNSSLDKKSGSFLKPSLSSNFFLQNNILGRVLDIVPSRPIQCFSVRNMNLLI